MPSASPATATATPNITKAVQDTDHLIVAMANSMKHQLILSNESSSDLETKLAETCTALAEKDTQLACLTEEMLFITIGLHRTRAAPGDSAVPDPARSPPREDQGQDKPEDKEEEEEADQGFFSAGAGSG